jgi:hypothetical protein
MIPPNSHPTYNEHQQKIIEMIDCALLHNSVFLTYLANIS